MVLDILGANSFFLTRQNLVENVHTGPKVLNLGLFISFISLTMAVPINKYQNSQQWYWIKASTILFLGVILSYDILFLLVFVHEDVAEKDDIPLPVIVCVCAGVRKRENISV